MQICSFPGDRRLHPVGQIFKKTCDVSKLFVPPTVPVVKRQIHVCASRLKIRLGQRPNAPFLPIETYPLARVNKDQSLVNTPPVRPLLHLPSTFVHTAAATTSSSFAGPESSWLLGLLEHTMSIKLDRCILSK